jgi:hypothetical protein
MFLDYVCDPRYGWVAECRQRAGAVPAQVFHERNSPVHAAEYEGRPERRPLTRGELQAFFDAADDLVERAGCSRRKGQLAVFRDAALFKVAYGRGLRRREAAMLDGASRARRATRACLRSAQPGPAAPAPSPPLPRALGPGAGRSWPLERRSRRPNGTSWWDSGRNAECGPFPRYSSSPGHRYRIACAMVGPIMAGMATAIHIDGRDTKAAAANPPPPTRRV